MCSNVLMGGEESRLIERRGEEMRGHREGGETERE